MENFKNYAVDLDPALHQQTLPVNPEDEVKTNEDNEEQFPTEEDLGGNFYD